MHGLIPGCSVSEISLRQFLTSREADMPLTPDLAQWQSLAADAFGMSAVQAAACMRLCFVLSQPSGHSLPLPTDDALRAPIGSLLLLLWVQWAHHELGESCATNVQRAQAADGEVWPSLHLPPAAAAAAALVDGNSQPSARTLAVQQRLHSAPQLARRRRPCRASARRARRLADSAPAAARRRSPQNSLARATQAAPAGPPPRRRPAPPQSGGGARPCAPPPRAPLSTRRGRPRRRLRDLKSTGFAQSF